MNPVARKSKKQPVARYATPNAHCEKYPPSESLKTLSTAKAVLTARHTDVSWRDIAWELGIRDRGGLSRVASGKREASAKLIAKLNSVYGCHIHLKTVKQDVPVCPICDEPYKPRHRCPSAPTKYAPHPVKRVTAIKALLNNKYLQS